MTIRIYQVDAFTEELFRGNPAAICPLDEWLPDALLQNIAVENNLSETGFCVKRSDHTEIRWFTPEVEVDLCGHATLAAAHTLFEHENFQGEEILFSSRSGMLKVKKHADSLVLDFPVDTLTRVAVPHEFVDGFGTAPLEAFKGKTDYMLVYGTEQEIQGMNPDLRLLAKVPCRGIIVTARGKEVDFVSRFFSPDSGIPEDPVTGSAHTSLVPYWSKKLGKRELTALQLSKRGGNLKCLLNGDRVEIAGKAKTYLIGQIFV